MSNVSSAVPMGVAAERLKRRMLAQFQTGRRMGATPMWLGGPGSGKTSVQRAMVDDVANILGARIMIHTVRPVDMQVTDIKGWPLPVKNPETGVFDALFYTRAAILPSVEEVEEYDHIVLRLDEFTQAPDDNMKALAEIILDYVSNMVVLDPKKFFVCATGNNVTDRAGSSRMFSHIVNRFQIINIQPDIANFLEYAERPSSGIPPIAVAFARMRPNLLMGDIPSEPNTPFCTFRSFVLGITDMAVHYGGPDADPNDPDSFAAAFAPANVGMATQLLAGCIGTGTASEFMNFAKVRAQLTPLDVIERDPHKAPVPQDGGALFAQASYLVGWVNKKNADAIFTYIARMRRDLISSTVMSIFRKDKTLVMTPAFATLAKEHQDVIAMVSGRSR